MKWDQIENCPFQSRIELVTDLLRPEFKYLWTLPAESELQFIASLDVTSNDLQKALTFMEKINETTFVVNDYSNVKHVTKFLIRLWRNYCEESEIEFVSLIRGIRIALSGVEVRNAVKGSPFWETTLLCLGNNFFAY